MAVRTPELRGLLDAQAYRVAAVRNGSLLEVLAADPPGAWGLRPDFLVVDEPAQWGPDLLRQAAVGGPPRRRPRR